MPTDFQALDDLYPLPADDLYRQWVLTRNVQDLPSQWRRRSHAGWHLAAHDDVHLCELRAADGTFIGWCLEPLVYLGSTGDVIPPDVLALPVGETTPAAVEGALYGRDEYGRSNGGGVQGSWVTIAFGGSEATAWQRVYLGAAHSVVYSPGRKTVATTHNLVPGIRREQRLSRACDPMGRNSFFAFGLTAFEDLHRLLPNHYLDLKTFTAIRHWPLHRPEPCADGRNGAAALVEHGRRHLGVLGREYGSFAVFLSAGRDSRAVLSVLRPFTTEGIDVRLETTYWWSAAALTDRQAARRLARLAGLPHKVRRRGRPTNVGSDTLRAFVRVGEAYCGPILSSPGVHVRESPANASFKVAGMGGETGRGYYWARRRLGQLDPPTISRLVGSPPIDAITDAAAKWLDELPQWARASAADVLDLAYVEQRLGCWQAPGSYLFAGAPRVGSKVARAVDSPMLSAFSVETMLRLPESYRESGQLQHDMVAYGWPELLAVPFNAPTGLLRTAMKANRLYRRAGPWVSRRLSSR